jgi:hypothetical protein
MGPYWVKLAPANGPVLLKSGRWGAQNRSKCLSERNGDKSRFGRLRKKKILRRKRNRELCEALSAPGPRVTARQKKQASRARVESSQPL